MAAATDTASIEDILEDLELHRALLQSLIETRPSAIEQRKELEATVMDFERQLARLRSVPYHTPLSQPPQSPRPLLQFDGAGGPSPAGHVVNHLNAFTPPQQRPSLQHKRSALVADFSSPTGSHMPKRARSQQPASSPQSAMSPYSRFSRDDSLGPDSDQLNDIFSFNDDDDLDMFQTGQYEAEKWLKERRAQERHDEEFARRLQQRLDEELGHIPQKQFQSPSKPHTVSETTTTSMSYPPGESSQTSRTPRNEQPVFGVPSFGDSSMLYRHPSHAPSPFTPGYQAYMQQGPSYEAEAFDSTDSDFSEITARDFYQSHTSTSPPFRGPSNHDSFQPQFTPPPGLFISSNPALLSNSFRPRYPSQLLNRGNPISGGSYGQGFKNFPSLSKVKLEKDLGIGSPASLHGYVDDMLFISW
jgi:hypothetical protein